MKALSRISIKARSGGERPSWRLCRYIRSKLSLTLSAVNVVHIGVSATPAGRGIAQLDISFRVLPSDPSAVGIRLAVSLPKVSVGGNGQEHDKKHYTDDDSDDCRA